MESRKDILKKLEDAIDKLDMSSIELELEKLNDMSETEIVPEDTALFSARIRALQKEKLPMKKSKKTMTAIIVAAAIALMSITVYASGILNRFTFAKDDTLTTVYTTESMTEQEAEEFVSDNEVPVDYGQVEEVETKELTFDTIEQAEKGMDMVLPLPTAISEFTLDTATGSIMSFGESAETRTVWLDYSDEKDRMLGVTVTREVLDPSTSITGATTHDMDPGSLGSYQTPTGIEYTTLTESDPNNSENVAHIAVATVGEYEYALVFFGFDQSQREAMIDSVDLSVYR